MWVSLLGVGGGRGVGLVGVSHGGRDGDRGVWKGWG